ncbi:hypothetical protein M8312_06840 [Sphingomonas sp. KRR8]|uniref:hypothetical protein n=1 Tax=Sphingomonas sp. KRR8 TaxID=2942996 RepID=UPI0020224DE5|nr:hypothetical protein [Sphingomonas sp. KRR8]URD62213.1 hypothetical protein M8312_06840 [Sphingomonas sp. KRR8]
MKELETGVMQKVDEAVRARRVQILAAFRRELGNARVTEEGEDIVVTGTELLRDWLMNAELRSVSAPQ